MAKTTVLLDFGSGPSTVVGPTTVYIRSVSDVLSGNKVILPGPGPVPLNYNGQASVQLDSGKVWEFVVSAPSYLSPPSYRVVPASETAVRYQDLVPVATPPESDDEYPAWVDAVFGALEAAEASALAAQSAADEAQRIFEQWDISELGEQVVHAETPQELRELIGAGPGGGGYIPSLDLATFGVVGDGVTDDYEALQAAFDSLTTGAGMVMLSNHYLSQEVTISKPGLMVIGGRFPNKGIRLVYTKDTSVAGAPDTIDLNLTMIGTRFEFPAVVQDQAAITMAGVRNINLIGVYAENAYHYIFIEPRNNHQHVRRVFVTGKSGAKNGSTAVRAAQATPTLWGVGDLHFVDFQFEAYERDFWMAGVDGLQLHDFTVFHAQNPKRDRSIDIEYCTWITIGGGHIFESGREAIRLSKFQNAQIIGNEIAWPGQLVPSDAILLENGDTDGFSNSNSIVALNFIQWPTNNGITQAPGVDCISYIGNRFESVGKGSKYTGTAALNTAEHFAILTPPVTTGFTSATRTVAMGNVVTGDVDPNTGLGTRFSFGHSGIIANNLDGRGLVQESVRALTVSGTTTSIDASLGYGRVTFNHSAATVVNSITPGYSGQRLELYAINANTTIQNADATVRLRDKQSVAIPTDGYITLRYVSGRWVEVSRSWETSYSKTEIGTLYFSRVQSDGRYVRTVNGIGPDTAGNVVVAGGAGSTATTSAQISDFQEAVQDAVAALLGAGTNITLNYDDANNSLTLTAAGGTTVDPEAIRDTIGVAMSGVGLITVSINDAADTIVITTTATANSTDAVLLARGNHTGSQSATTVNESTDRKWMTAAERARVAVAVISDGSVLTTKRVTQTWFDNNSHDPFTHYLIVG